MRLIRMRLKYVVHNRSNDDMESLRQVSYVPDKDLVTDDSCIEAESMKLMDGEIVIGLASAAWTCSFASTSTFIFEELFSS